MICKRSGSAALHSLDVEDRFALVHERDSVGLMDGKATHQKQPIRDHREPSRVRPPNHGTKKDRKPVNDGVSCRKKDEQHENGGWEGAPGGGSRGTSDATRKTLFLCVISDAAK